jgi:hypothetical protein
MNTTSRTCTLILVAVFSLLLESCGGDGYGDGSSGGSSGVTYSGKTTAASITTSNGEEIATGAYQNGGTGQSLGTVLALELPGSHHNGEPRAAILAKALASAAHQIDPATITAPSSNHAIQYGSGTIFGGCGGYASYTTNYNDVTGEFSGSISFTSYCEEAVTLNGTLSMTGALNPSNPDDFGSLTMTFTALTVASGSDSFTADGTINFNAGANPTTVTMTMEMKDNTTNEVFLAQDFILSITQNITHIELTMSGRFYHPDHGYVDVSTPTPFRINSGDEWPSSGVLMVTGENGSAKLTVLSTTSFQIDIDTNGDGASDQTTTGNWATI